MMVPNFADRLCEAVRTKKSILCAGLDPQLRYMPTHLVRKAFACFGNRDFLPVGWLFEEFNRQIIDAVHDIVVCVKPNMAFYERYGSHGLTAFENTVAYAKSKGLLVIGDVKRGDGGDTADAYADGYLGEVPFLGDGDDPTILTQRVSPIAVDCITVHGYIGEDCVGRFIRVASNNCKGIFVVDKTSFKPNSVVEQLMTMDEMPVWLALAHFVNKWGEGTEGAYGLRNVGVVMGATYPSDAPRMREALPNSIFLIPGLGGQSATANDAVVGIRSDGFGGIVNDSRNLIYAWQNKKGEYQCVPEKFAEAARLQAIYDRDALIVACSEAHKWPHS